VTRTRPRSVARRRRGGFHPPHCPNPACHFHAPNPNWHYVRNGSYRRPSDRRRVQAFLCRACRRSFSTQTFSLTYWLRRPALLARVAAAIVEGPGLRQLGRVIQASHQTIARLTARLGRQGLLFHLDRLAHPEGTPGCEPTVIDGFESFAYSHYFLFDLNLAIGQQSHFIYHFNHAPLRRKGAMTNPQKQHRAKLEKQFGRPDPKATERSVRVLLRELLQARGRLLKQTANPHPETPSHWILHMDDHHAYRRSIRTLRQEPGTPSIKVKITSSRERRTTSNPLFAVNLADLLLRHGSANHRRETIAYSKRIQTACERAAAFLVWRNYVKRWSENGAEETVAMRAGICQRPYRWRDILRRRLFAGQFRLPEAWREYIEARVPSPPYQAWNGARMSP
jgi:transposase-like protein